MTRQRQSIFFLLIIFLVTLVACNSPSGVEPVPEQTGPEAPAADEVISEQAPPEEITSAEDVEESAGAIETADSIESEVAEPETAAAAESVVSNRPDWHHATLTDVRTDETFTIADFDGKIVIVETMAVWCPLCETQQFQINSALAKLGDNVVAVSLDTDPSETAAILSQHADRLGVDWHFVIADAELSGMLQNEYGPQILSPPATPVLIIDQTGNTELTPFGIKEWTDLLELINPLLS